MKKRYSLDSRELQEVIAEQVKKAEKNYSMEVKSQNDKSSHRDVIQQISLRDITQHGRTL